MNEQELTAYVDHYLGNLKSREKVEDAIHSLMDVVPEATDLLLQHYNALDDLNDRHSILQVFLGTFSTITSKSQRVKIIEAFGKDLLSDRSESWKYALDLLYTAEDEVALTHLKSGLAQAIQTKNAKKEEWIREVIADRK